MDVKKYKSGEFVAVLKHDLRRLPDGSSNSNPDIQPELTKNNSGLVERGKTVEEVVGYIHDIEKQIFIYNRADLVHTVEWVVTMPTDCTDEAGFFNVAEKYFESTLPDSKFMICSEIHRDEKFVNPHTGEIVSKQAHMHVMYIPAVRLKESEREKIKNREVNRLLKEKVKQEITGKHLRVELKKAGKSKEEIDRLINNLTEEYRKEISSKVPEYEYKLDCNSTLNPKTMPKYHPGLQQALDKAGIQATVYHPSSGANYIHLDGKQLKAITRITGQTISKSLTVDEFSNLISKSISLENQNSFLKDQLHLKDQQISELKEHISVQKDIEKSVPDKQIEVERLQEKYDALKDAYEQKSLELEQAKEKIKDLKAEKEIKKDKSLEWGSGTQSWGSSGWEKSNEVTVTVDDDM